MTKPFLYFLILITFFSCKKKEDENDITPSTATTPEVADYQSNLQTRLSLTRNMSNFDTSFSFVGKYLKIIGPSQTWSSFPSTDYNGYIANSGNNFNGDVVSSSNFMALATNSSWTVNSSEFGNFQHIDSIALGTINTSLSVIPTTYDASQGIPIKITGIQGTPYLILSDKSQLYFSNAIRSYSNISFPTPSAIIIDTLRDFELSFVPINTTFTLSINCNVRLDKYINGHKSFVFKSTSYYYPIKRIN